MSLYEEFISLLNRIEELLPIVPNVKQYEINRIKWLRYKMELYSGQFDYLSRYYKHMIPQLKLYLKELQSTIQVA